MSCAPRTRVARGYQYNYGDGDEGRLPGDREEWLKGHTRNVTAVLDFFVFYWVRMHFHFFPLKETIKHVCNRPAAERKRERDGQQLTL